MKGYDALWCEDATEEEQVECYQRLVDSGDAWKLEGHVGRTAMNLIEHGAIMLGHRGHRDYWGNYVPARTDVQEGTKGSYQFVVQHHGEEYAKHLAQLGAN